MDKFTQLNQILDVCLAMGLLKQFSLPNSEVPDKNHSEETFKAKSRLVQISLTRAVAYSVETKLDRELSSEETAIVCQRVDKFLLEHGVPVDGNSK